jgi:hypothetical protein
MGQLAPYGVVWADLTPFSLKRYNSKVPVIAGSNSDEQVARDVKIILVPPCIIISSVILHTRHTGRRRNGFHPPQAFFTLTSPARFPLNRPRGPPGAVKRP